MSTMESNDNHEKRSLDDTDPNSNLRVVGDPITSCGCGPCKPLWAQFFANPKLFTAHCIAIVATMICSFSYFGGILTTVERQFELSSSESGTLTIINDVVSLSLVLFASYFGHGSHRPRWVASGTILSGIGTFLLAMPHFASDPLDPNTILYGKTSKMASVCRSETRTYSPVGSVESVDENNSYPLSLMNNYTFAEEECETSSNGLGHIWWFIIGNILIGIGNAPLYPLITTYIDDAVGKRRLVSYMAFLFMSFAIGPSLGFLFSAQTTKLYVDFDRVPADQIPDIDQSDPRWIGAWWLGLVACGTLLILLGIPMFFYPKIMVNNSPEDAEREKETKDADEGEDDIRDAFGGKGIFEKKESQNGVIDVIKGLMFTMKRLVTNVTLISMCLGGSAETATIGIFAAFSVKYFQTQFGLSPGASGMLVGGAIIPCNIISNLVSAWIVRHFKLTSRQCALFVIIGLSLSGVLLPIMMATGCENPDIAGITVPYNSVEDTKQNTAMSYRPTTNVNLELTITDNTLNELEDSQISGSICNADCGCSDNVFQPVCGSDEITYISACHAGCLGEDASLSENGTDKVYVNCSCTISSSYSSNATAKSGQCPIECDSYKLPLIVFLCAASFFLMALTGNPLIFIILRCVKADDRSVALGLKSLITKVLGFFPSPVYFGAIINSTCIYWQYTCGNRGACWIYDIVKYRYAYFGTLFVLRICSVFCYTIMYFSIKPEKSKTTSEDKKDTDETLQLKQKPTPV